MSSYGPIANQRTKTRAKVKLSSGDYVYLDPGHFVKYVKKEYLPRDHPFGDYNEDYMVAAYTKLGMALIERCDLDFEVY